MIVFGGILTANPSNWAHLLVLLPPATLFAALALDQLYELAAPGAGARHRLARPLAATVVILVLALAGEEKSSSSRTISKVTIESSNSWRPGASVD